MKPVEMMKKQEMMKKRLNPKDPTVASFYLAFFSFVASLWGHHWSAFMASSFAFRMLASVQLMVFVRKQESVEGISANSVVLYACSHAFRLCSTLWLKGYLPSDSVADNYLCQIMDIVALACNLYVVYQCWWGRLVRETYLREQDCTHLGLGFATCVFLAYFFHGDLDDKPLFDTLFFVGVFCNCFALAPQLWLMSKDRYSRQYLTWNYVLPVVGACVTSLLFWRYAYLELVSYECKSCETEECVERLCSNWVGYATIGAHLVHCLLVMGLLLRNAPLDCRLNVTDTEVTCYFRIPTLPAPSGPASNLGV